MLAELLQRMVHAAANFVLLRFDRGPDKLRRSKLRGPMHTAANDPVRLVDANFALGKTGNVPRRLRLVRHTWRST
jgi:hypothetical protein